MFSVGAFLGKKSPTLTVANFFSSDHRPHRVCTTFYRLHSRSHVLVSTRFTVNPAVTGSSTWFSQKLFRAIFFDTVQLFFDFFLSPKGPPSSFLIFCNRLDFQKVERVPPLTNFKNCAFLSLRYSADFRRSRLVCSPDLFVVGGGLRSLGLQ